MHPVALARRCLSVVQRLSHRASPCPSCISLPAAHPLANLALACQKPLPDASAPRCARPVASLPGRPQPPASVPRPATVSPRRLGQPLHHSAPASNKPHLAEKSTPVWLAIWRTWAGFANSQLRCANFCSNYSYKCSSPLLPHWAAARTQQISRPICTDCLRHLRISAR